jgi:hypothetical protein
VSATARLAAFAVGLAAVFAAAFGAGAAFGPEPDREPAPVVDHRDGTGHEESE